MTISKAERDLRAKAMASALASVRLDGLEPSPHAQSLLLAWVSGSISLDEICESLVTAWSVHNDG